MAIVDLVYVLILLNSEKDRSASTLVISITQAIINSLCIFGKESLSHAANPESSPEQYYFAPILLSMLLHWCLLPWKVLQYRMHKFQIFTPLIPLDPALIVKSNITLKQQNYKK